MTTKKKQPSLEPAAARVSTLRQILYIVRPYVPRLLVAVFFSLAASAANGGIALYVKPVTDTIFIGKNAAQLKWMPLALIGFFFLRGVSQMIYAYLMKSASLKLVRDYRIRIHDHLLALSMSSLRKEASGRVISRLLNDTAVLRSLVSDIFLDTLKEVPTIVVLVTVAMYRRWDISLLALVVLPGIVAGAQRLGARVKIKRKQAQHIIAQLTHRIGEATSGAKVIKIFCREKATSARFAAESRALYRREVKIVRFREMNKLLVDVGTGIGGALVAWYGGKLIVRGIITPGDFLSALGAIVMVFTPVKRVGTSYTMLQEVRAALDRIRWLEEMPAEQSGGQPLASFERVIALENLSHRYQPDGEEVLTNINLTIQKGEAVAIVGPSGAGKTSLIDLIPRFYDPCAGTVSIDGHDLKTVKLADLRSLIGLVTQDVLLFNDTFRENIAFGRADATHDEIEAAARMSHAHEFITELPDGYDTMLGERGLNLSGGQRQRIALARAILKNPPILILDEATSALDSVSEKLVQQALERLMKEKTTIVVAHRLSTILHADRIVVMEHGRIVAQGRHEDLLESCPTYRELYLTFEQNSASHGPGQIT